MTRIDKAVGMLTRPSLSLRTLAAALALTTGGRSVAALESKDAPAPLLHTIDGRRRPAELYSVGDGKLSFQSAGQTVYVPAERLISWGAPVEPRGAPQVLLADGGLLAVRQVLKTDDDRLLVYSDTFDELAVPLELVAAVVFHPPIDPERRDLLARRLREGGGSGTSTKPDKRPKPKLAKSPAGRATGHERSAPARNADRLLLENGDELSGHVVAVTDKGVEFTSEVGPISVGAERVVALALDPGLWRKAAASAQRRLVGFNDGTLLIATSLTAAEGRVKLEVPGGLETTAKAEALVFLQTLGGQATYLSDLRPADYRHLPYLSERWDFQFDAAVNGARLRAGGRLYAKGIGMHSAARLTFRLQRPYRRFEAELAIDDQTSGRGSVVFRLFSGSQQIYQSPVVRGGAKPLGISVAVEGVQQLSLVVDYADRGDVLDRADWLNARLIEKSE